MKPIPGALLSAVVVSQLPIETWTVIYIYTYGSMDPSDKKVIPKLARIFLIQSYFASDLKPYEVTLEALRNSAAQSGPDASGRKYHILRRARQPI